MAASQHSTPNPSKVKRRKKVVPPSLLRWDAVELPKPPSNEAWVKDALQEIPMVRAAYMIAKDDADVMFERLRSNGTDPLTWQAFMAFERSFTSISNDLKARAKVYDMVAARIYATIERAISEAPECLDALDKAAQAIVEKHERQAPTE